MKKEKSIFIFRIVFILIGWFGVIGSSVLKVIRWHSNGDGALMGLLDSISHYTIQSNILVLVWLTVTVLNSLPKGERRISNSVYKTGITLYITFTFIIYELILEGLWTPTGIDAVLANITHYVTPIVFILDWFICEFLKDRSERQKWSNALKWLVYPLCYAVYVIFIYGNFTGKYMYPFLHVPSKGYLGVLIRVGILCICFILMGVFYITASNIIHKISFLSTDCKDKKQGMSIEK